MALDSVPEPPSAGLAAKSQHQGATSPGPAAARSLTGSSRLNWPALLFIAGLAAGFCQLCYYPVGIEMGPGHEMVDIARNLAKDGTFGNPFSSLPTGPTAIEPPLYPLFIALSIKLFGTHGLLPYWVMVLANIAVNAFTVAFLPRASALLFGTRVPGVISAVFSLAASRLMPAWDASFTQFGLVLLFLITALLLRKAGRFALHGAIVGAITGLLCLLNPMSVPVAVLCVAFLLIARRTGLRACTRFFALLLIMAPLVILPWIVRNYNIWGRLIVRTTLGIALYTSNNDCAEPRVTMEQLNGCYGVMYPNWNPREAQLFHSMGELAYDRQRAADAIAWMRSHPGRFWWLTWRRIVEFWLPYPTQPLYSCYAVWAATILSIPGLIWMGWKREPAAVLIVAVFLVYPLMYYIVVSDMRYRVPILWLSCLAAGYFVSSLVPRLRNQVR